MRRIGALLAITTIAAAFPVGAASGLDGSPTKLAKQAKALGITEAGTKYQFEEEERNSDTLFLTVDVPTAWSDRADSHFINPDTNEPYGVGLRATTDADAFHNSFDVPGMRITANGLSPSEVDKFDADRALDDNAVEGCRPGDVRTFDNGTYEGKYQVYDRCGPNEAAAVVVAATGRSEEIQLSGQVLTKADLKALDRILGTAKVEKTST